MKTIIFTILSITIGYGQIEADNGSIIWKHIEQYENGAESLLNQLKSSGKFSSLELLNNTVVGKFVDAPIDTQGTASMYLMASNMKGSFTIQFKDERFRISAKNIQFISQTSVGVFDEGSIEPIERYALNKNGEFRKRFKSKDLPIIEKNLNKLFELPENDDW